VDVHIVHIHTGSSDVREVRNSAQRHNLRPPHVNPGRALAERRCRLLKVHTMTARRGEGGGLGHKVERVTIWRVATVGSGRLEATSSGSPAPW
jgi:hypothetical protein